MTSEDRLRHLVDRAEISDLMHAFATALDGKDWEGYAETYAPDGRLELWGNAIARADLAAATERNLGRFHATHHISANHQIQVDGDTATTRSYFQAVHVDHPESRDHWTIGGWYEGECLRTPEGWRFSVVRLQPVWQTGQPPEWASAE